MPTIFNNTLINEETSQGKITTLSEWSVWDCYTKKWSEKPAVVFRNIMLSALYPKKEFCMGEISPNEKNSLVLNPFKPKGEEDGYFLDLASGSRTHGRFTFAQGSTVGKLYYGSSNKDQWKRIIYGSIVHTGCKQLVYKNMKYIVVDDEAKDENGNPMDDLVNKINWKTGDSHAKGSSIVMAMLELPRVEGQETAEIPIQFRASLRAAPGVEGWVGKGTIAYSRLCEQYGVDLVIPLSCLKGNKPSLGNHNGKILMGTVFEAEERRTKLGWMIWQWFAFSTLEQDNIISNLREKAQKLGNAFNSIQNLASILRVEQLDVSKEMGESVEDDSYKTPVLRIIKADKKGILLLHPYVIERVSDGIKEMWLNLAKSAGVKFYSLMAQPDESLAHYHIVQPDGTIVGRKVFCAGIFPEGEYIVYCNPMRHWGDIQIWENRHEGTYVGAIGTMAAPRKLLASLGRDTDGDFVQLIRASKYPALRDAIANFDKPPVVAKFPKVALSGNIKEIAVRSMTDLTGVVASLLGRARAANAEQIVLKIPPGGEQKEEREMRIIEFLSQELQIAVDSLKSAYPNNVAGIDAVKKFLDSRGASAPWLKDFKDESCYKNRPCAVDPNATDTVSRIVQLVNSYYRPASIGADSSPRNYLAVLFGDVPHAKEQYDYAIRERSRYREQMISADNAARKQAGDDDDLYRLLSSKYKKDVSANFKSSKEIAFSTLSPNGEEYSQMSWVSAYWKASHEAETGSAGLVFSIFVDEIIDKLSSGDQRPTIMIEAYATQHGEYGSRIWTGELVRVRAMVRTVKGKERLIIEADYGDGKGFKYVGICGERHPIPAGETKEMKMCTHREKNGQSTTIRFLDPSLTYEQAIEYLNYPLNRWDWDF